MCPDGHRSQDGLQRLVQRLAELVGVGSDYYDGCGTLRSPSLETRQHLLCAMGYPAEQERDVHQAIADVEAKRRRSVLRAVQVSHEGSPTVRLTLPASHLDQQVDWTLVTEDGREETGTFRAADLPLASQTETNEGGDYRELSLALPDWTPCGYHRFAVVPRGAAPPASDLREMSYIVAPARCYQPGALDHGRRVWGLATQVWALRSGGNWGLGDYSDVGKLVQTCARLGGSVVGITPLHALFPQYPSHISPYSASSRLFNNVSFIDVQAMPDYAECEKAHRLFEGTAFQSELQQVRETELVAYERVWRLKHQMFEMLFEHFCEHHLGSGTDYGHRFVQFEQNGGELLQLHCVFEALAEHFGSQGGEGPWWQWPEAYRDPRTDEVAQFSREHRRRVLFYLYLQWQAELQLAGVGLASERSGLGVGLYQDLAVSIDAAGAEAWSRPGLFARGISLGAPPDFFNHTGQSWGLLPWIPEQLEERGYQPLIEVLRANMRYAGALRIDHVMGLLRQFWVPPNELATGGAYVHFPFDDLLGVVALESVRNGCLVVGEDLGTVPPQVREKTHARGIYGYRLLYFERDDAGGFADPDRYAPQAVAAVSTHDLPTLRGYWTERDLEWREKLQLYRDEAQAQEQRRARAHDRQQLVAALDRAALLPEDTPDSTPQPLTELTPQLNRAVHAFLARTPSALLLAQLDDLWQVEEQANLPGTIDEHPNWLRKAVHALEDLEDMPLVRQILHAVARERG